MKRKASSSFFLLKVTAAVVICCCIGANGGQRKSAAPPDRKSISAESFARDNLNELDSRLTQLSYAMDDFDFDKIHWKLFDIYACYARLDTLADPQKRQPQDSLPAIISDRRAKMLRTQSFIDSFIVAMEKASRTPKKHTAELQDSTVTYRPVLQSENDSTTTRRDVVFDPFEALRKDSTETVILTIKNRKVQNKVEYELAKLKEKTAKMHRYFDAGEFSMSRSELAWLIDYLSGVKQDIINYIAAAEQAETSSHKPKESD